MAGQVLYKNGTPIYNARVKLSNSSYSRTDYTNYSGHYYFEQFAGGEYLANTTPPSGPNIINNVTNVTLHVNQTLELDIIMPEGGILTGTVFATNGTPISSHSVHNSIFRPFKLPHSHHQQLRLHTRLPACPCRLDVNRPDIENPL